MTSISQHVLICYGTQLGYHHGAKYQILRNLHWLKTSQICVVTDKPELFSSYPVRVLSLDQAKVKSWSLNGSNHFGIKLKGLNWAIETSDDQVTKSILLDTDMYWIRNPNALIRQVSIDTFAMYQSEGFILGSKNKSINRYEEGLKGKNVKCGKKNYQLSAESSMWGSAVIGVHHSNRKILNEAFDLFCCLSPLVAAHTVEQFALSEVIRDHRYKKIPAKKFLNDWSSIGRKNYATAVLGAFFEKYGEHDFNKHLEKLHEVRIHRPLFTLIKQKLARWKTR